MAFTNINPEFPRLAQAPSTVPTMTANRLNGMKEAFRGAGREGILPVMHVVFMTMGVKMMINSVFDAIEKSGIPGKGIVRGIREFGDNALKLAIKAPLSIPIIPAIGGGKTSALEATKLLNPKEYLQKIDATGLIGMPTTRKQPSTGSDSAS